MAANKVLFFFLALLVAVAFSAPAPEESKDLEASDKGDLQTAASHWGGWGGYGYGWGGYGYGLGYGGYYPHYGYGWGGYPGYGFYGHGWPYGGYGFGGYWW